MPYYLNVWRAPIETITSNPGIAVQLEPHDSISQKGCNEIRHETAVSLVPVMPALLAIVKDLFPILRMINIPSACAQLDPVAVTDVHCYQAAIPRMCSSVVSAQDREDGESKMYLRETLRSRGRSRGLIGLKGSVRSDEESVVARSKTSSEAVVDDDSVTDCRFERKLAH